MYELIILSLLMRRATHGYVIAGVINDVIGPFARASNGRIYPLLTRLEEQGLVAVHEEATSAGGRVSRSFSITGPGRARFRELMLDTAGSPREYRDLFAFKVTAFAELAPGDRRALIQHYLDFAQAHVRHLALQGRDLAEAATYGHTREQRRRFSSVFEHLVAVWQREADWAGQLLAAEGATTRTAAGAPLHGKAAPRHPGKRPGAG
jgi:DNA-binding PadR family transcriptional regulator